MNIQEEILSDFFSMLEKNNDFPRATIHRLKELWEQGNLANKSEIKEAIIKGMNDVSKSEIS